MKIRGINNPIGVANQLNINDSKLLEAQDQLLELYRKEKELIFKKLEIITEYYDTIQSKLQAISSSLDAQISANAARGISTSVEDLIKQFSALNKILESETEELLEYQTGIDTRIETDGSRKIDKYVEDLQASLNNANTAIASTELYQNLIDTNKMYEKRLNDYNTETENLKNYKQELKDFQKTIKSKNYYRNWVDSNEELLNIQKEQDLSAEEINLLKIDLIFAQQKEDKDRIAKLKQQIKDAQKNIKNLKLSGKDKKEWKATQNALDGIADLTVDVSDDLLYKQQLERAKELQDKLNRGEKLTGKEKSEYNNLTKKVAGVYDSINKTIFSSENSKLENLILQIQPYKDKQQKYEEADAEIARLQKLYDTAKKQGFKDEAQNIKNQITALKKIRKENKLKGTEKKMFDTLNAQIQSIETLQSIQAETVDNSLANSATYNGLISDYNKLSDKSKLSNKEQNKLKMLADTIATVNEKLFGATTQQINDFVSIYQKWWKEENKRLNGKNYNLTNLNKWSEQLQKYYDASAEYLENLANNAERATTVQKYLNGEMLSEEVEAEMHNWSYEDSKKELEKTYNDELEKTREQYKNTSAYKNMLKKFNNLAKQVELDENGEVVNWGKLSKAQRKNYYLYKEYLDSFERGVIGSSSNDANLYKAALGNVLKYAKRDENGKYIRNDEGYYVALDNLTENQRKIFDVNLAKIKDWDKLKAEEMNKIEQTLNDALEELETKHSEQVANDEAAIAEAQEKVWGIVKQLAEYSITKLQEEIDAYDALMSRAKNLADILSSASLKRIAEVDTSNLFGLNNFNKAEDIMAKQYADAIDSAILKGQALSKQGSLYKELIEAANTAVDEADFTPILDKYRENASPEMLEALDKVQKLLDENSWDSNTWITEWNKAFAEVESNLAGTVTEIQELKDALRENVYLKTIQQAIDLVDKLNSRISSLSDLINDEWVRDSNGITEFGYAKVNQLSDQLDNSRNAVELWAAEIKKIEEARDTYATEYDYQMALQEAYENYNKALGNTESIMMSIYQIAKEAAETEISNINKIIELQKKALQSKRDYYEYDKTVKQQSNDVKKIQAQIAAFENVQTAEAKAKVAQLQSDLKEAQDTLADTKMEHLFDLEAKALDDFIVKLEETLDTSNQTIEETFADFVEKVNSLIETAKGTDTDAAYQKIIGALMNNQDTTTNTFGTYLEESQIKSTADIVKATELAADDIVSAIANGEGVNGIINNLQKRYDESKKQYDLFTKYAETLERKESIENDIVSKTDQLAQMKEELNNLKITSYDDFYKSQKEALEARLKELNKTSWGIAYYESQEEREEIQRQLSDLQGHKGKYETEYSDYVRSVQNRQSALSSDIATLESYLDILKNKALPDINNSILEQESILKEFGYSIDDVTNTIDTLDRVLTSLSSTLMSYGVVAGSSGTAHASGQNQALVGELGGELRVNPHTGKYDVLGANGAEFRKDIHKDDIIFNANQTKALLKNGHISSRGKAFAKGTADPFLSRLLHTSVTKSHALDYSTRNSMVEGRAFANGTVSNVNSESHNEINVHYDSLLTVNGAVDATVVSDIQKLLKQSYQYTKKQLTSDLKKVGIS